MKKIHLLFILQLLCIRAFAQIDTKFWFAAPDIDVTHGDQPIFIRFVAVDQNTNVQITQPANSGFAPLNVFAPLNIIQSFDLTPRKNLLENQPANTVLNKGLLIEADDNITVYYEIGNGDNTEIFPLKGRNALGKNFRIPAQNDYNNNNGRAEFDIVATEDNTQITITPTEAIVGHAANTTFTITLNAGQTFAARAISTNTGGTLAGSKITADKEIAVTTMDDSVFFGNGWDLIGDQIIPVETLGKKYIAIKGNANSEKVYIVATEDNTNIFLNGQTTAAATLNDGDMFAQTITGNSLFIESDKPTYVMQVSGVGDEFGDALLPPITCTGSSKVVFMRTSPQDFDLFVMTESENESSFSINGNPNLLNANDFQPVSGTNGDWVFAKKNFPSSQIGLNANAITNSSGLFHLGVLTSTGTGSTFGYFSDYKSGTTFSIGNQQDETISAGESLPVTIDLIPNAGTTLPTNITYDWSPTTGVNNINSNDVIITPTATTTYTFTATSAEGCPQTISFTVTVNPTEYGIPNAFAPNGRNTHFYPITAGTTTVKSFRIYSRWGQLIFDGTDGIGWDGTLNGKEQPQDTYVYVGEIEMPNGEIVPIKGGFLLVR